MIKCKKQQRNSVSDCLYKMCVESVKVIPTHEAYTDKHTLAHVQYEIFILSTRQITFTIVNFFLYIVYGFEIKQRDTQNNLHIMTCDCSSMTRYLCDVRFFLPAAHRSVTQPKQEQRNEY